jgi:hypothetical protein
MQKKCTRCKKTKPYTEFQKRAATKTGCASMCRPCKQKYDREHYAAHPHRRQYIKLNRRAARNKAHEFICEYLSTHPCVDCGESDPIVLEFDHVRGQKLNSVSRLKNCSAKAVAREIKKCVVRCANCHRRKTAKQFKWSNKNAPIA